MEISCFNCLYGSFRLLRPYPSLSKIQTVMFQTVRKQSDVMFLVVAMVLEGPLSLKAYSADARQGATTMHIKKDQLRSHMRFMLRCFSSPLSLACFAWADVEQPIWRKCSAIVWTGNIRIRWTFFFRFFHPVSALQLLTFWMLQMLPPL